MTADYSKLYRRKEWKDKRLALIEERKACESCGETDDLQVHHPHYEKGKMPWEYDNLQVLCNPCHRKADIARKMQFVNGSHPVASNALTGKFFHSINQKGYIEWQGYVVGGIQDGFYLVQLFEWMMGEQNICYIVHFTEMLGWFFYKTADQMTYSYDYGVAKRHKTPEDKGQNDIPKGLPA